MENQDKQSIFNDFCENLVYRGGQASQSNSDQAENKEDISKLDQDNSNNKSKNDKNSKNKNKHKIKRGAEAAAIVAGIMAVAATLDKYEVKATCSGGCWSDCKDTCEVSNTDPGPCISCGMSCGGGCWNTCSLYCNSCHSCTSACDSNCTGNCSKSCNNKCSNSCSATCGGGCTQGCGSGCEACTSCTGSCKDGCRYRGTSLLCVYRYRQI